MKPLLYTHETKQGNEATLVDLDSIYFVKDESGKERAHFATAVEIGRISSGPIVIDTDKAPNVLLYPRPCVFELKKNMKELPPIARGINLKAAEVLLDLARSANNITLQFAKQEWTFGVPVKRGVKHGWDGWKFIAAWKWSSWEARNIKGDYRHRVMKDLGYPKSYATMRKMMADLGLVTRRNQDQ